MRPCQVQRDSHASCDEENRRLLVRGKLAVLFEVKLVSMEISIEYFMGVEPVLK